MLPTQPTNFTATINNPLNTQLPTLQNSSLNLTTRTVQSLQGASQTIKTFTVSNTNDSGTGSLRQAILNANVDSAKNPTHLETINFNLGTGSHTIKLTSAVLDITAKNLTINGIGTAGLTISGGNTVQDFKIEAGANVTISGLTIADGMSASSGGGILNNGTLTLNNNTITNNSTNKNLADGGGIFNNGTLTLNGDTFTNNTALSNAGGAIFNAGTLTIANSSFTGNSAVNGGAIESSGILSITGSTFTQNTGTGGFGGAIADVGNGKLTITGSSFTGNIAAGGFGGAILNNNASTLTVTNSTFTNNKAGLGAAIYNDNAHGATASALGLTFSGDLSTGSNATPTINNDTFGNFTIAVDTLQDLNDSNFSAGHLSLRNAIAGAIIGETITFAPALTNGTIVLTHGELAINKSLSIQGLGATQLTIDANHQSHDFNIGVGANVSISGLTITNGSSESNNFGGDIYNMGTLALNNDVISGGTADLGGAGIFNNTGTLILANTTVSNNTGGNGAGLENIGGTATVISSFFTANVSPNGLGGAINNAGTLNVIGTVFSQNTALVGGGAIFDNGTTTITISTFNNNSTHGKGGAIEDAAIPGLGSVTVTGSSFFGNVATLAAGVPGDTVDVFGPVTFA